MEKLRPWSVKGVSSEARDAARQAATQSELSIGAWIDEAITRACSADTTSSLPAAAPADIAYTPAIEEAVTALEQQIASSQTRISQAIAPVRDAMDMLAVRVDALEREGRLAPGTGLFLEPNGRPGVRPTEQRSDSGSAPLERPSSDAPLRMGKRAVPASPPKPYGRVWRRAATATALLSTGGLAAFIAIWFSVVKGPGEDLRITALLPAGERTAAAAELPSTLPLLTSLDGVSDAATLRRQASRGDAQAQADLASRYIAGDGVPRDYPAAARWLAEAAAIGLRDAQYNLGVLYSRGLGLAANPTQAAIWFQRAAEQGHVKAQYALGLSYAQARGVGRNYSEAASWLERAARLADPEAQFALAVILEDGLAGQADPEGALFWYRAAVANGSARAAERAALLAPHLSPDQPQAEISLAGRRADPEIVTRTQQLLAKLDFYPGAAHGRLDDVTRAAIREYQAQLGLRVDGEASDRLLQHLIDVTSASK